MNTFEYPWVLLLLVPGLAAVWKLVRQKGAIGYSSLELLQGISVGGRALLLAERLLLTIFVTACTLILARPIMTERTTIPEYREARDIVIALDISGSMAYGNLSIAQRVITEFVEQRPQDRIGLFSFDTTAYLEWPLSADHGPLIYRLTEQRTVGGTTISSGMIAGLRHLQSAGQNSGALIVVSDGASTLTPQQKSDIEEALGETRLYWISIGTQDALAKAFGTYAESLGGKVFIGRPGELADFFDEISRLEASPVVWEQHVSTVYRFGFLPLLALLSLLGAGILEVLREV